MPYLFFIIALAILAFVSPTATGQEMYMPEGAKPRIINDDNLHIYTCGTGIPQVTMQDIRRPACLAIYANKQLMLFDAGDGAVQTLARMGLPYLALQHIFLTHLHSDHMAGLGELMNATWHSGRKLPITIHGPYGTLDVVQGFIKAYRLDVLFRAIGGGGLLNPNLAYAAVDTLPKTNGPKIVYDQSGLKITAFPVNHLPVFPAYGYQINYKGCKIVFSGDTKIFSGLSPYYANADVLINESVSVPLYNQAVAIETKGNRQMMAFAQQIFSYHSNSLELAKLAQQANVKYLILTHLLPAIGTTDPFKSAFTQGMKQFFTNTITVANDRDEFIVSKDCKVTYIPAKQPEIPIVLTNGAPANTTLNNAASTPTSSVSPTNMQSHSITFTPQDGRLNGLTMHYNIGGQGTETVLFVHGLPLNATSWNNQVDYFDKKYRVITLDLFGFGTSSPLPDVNVPDLSGLYADSIKALLTKLNIHKVVFVGFAIGGHVGMKFAVDNPALVSKLVLINTSPTFMVGNGWPYGFTPTSAGKFISTIKSASLSDSLDFIINAATLEQCPNISQIRTELLQMSTGATKKTLLSFFENLAKEDFRSLLPKIQAPTLIIKSALDKQVPFGVGLYVRDHIPNAQLTEINGMDHFVFATASDLVNQLIENFINPTCSESH